MIIKKKRYSCVPAGARASQGLVKSAGISRYQRLSGVSACIGDCLLFQCVSATVCCFSVYWRLSAVSVCISDCLLFQRVLATVCCFSVYQRLSAVSVCISDRLLFQSVSATVCCAPTTRCSTVRCAMRSNSARRMRTRPTLTSASTRPANMRNIDIGISSVSISKLTWLLL